MLARVYWVNGSGSWDDLSHWSKTSGTPTPIGHIPTARDEVIIDDNAGLTAGAVLTIPPGEFEVGSIEVTTTGVADWALNFAGTSGNLAALLIYSDLSLSTSMSVTYDEPNLFRNVWRFVGNGTHDIQTAGLDLLHVEFRDNGTFRQIDNL